MKILILIFPDERNNYFLRRKDLVLVAACSVATLDAGVALTGSFVFDTGFSRFAFESLAFSFDSTNKKYKG